MSTMTTALGTSKLTAADRCDVGRCPAQAFVEVQFSTGTLLFCSHHYNKMEAALFEWAIDIYDERHLINAKPDSSA